MIAVESSKDPFRSLVITGLSLSLLLLLLRAQIVHLILNHPVNYFYMFLIGYYDIAYAAALTSFFLVLLALFRKKTRITGMLNIVYFVIALFSLVVAALNIQVVEKIGSPFSYQWLYYSDFLQSHDTRQAILTNFSWNVAFTLFAVILAFFILVLLGRFIARRFHLHFFGYAAGLLLLVYFPVAKRYVDRPGWERTRLENPVVFFLQSMINRAPVLLTMSTTVGPDDFLPRKISKQADPSWGKSKIRNVILFVFESLPSQYVDVYGSPYGATPTIHQYRQHAAIFKSIYAQQPATGMSVFSILSGMHPMISYRSVTAAYPDIPFPSLSSELHQRGYRTGFFNSSNNDFNGIKNFLSYRKFDRIEDYRNRNCNAPIFIGDKKYSSSDVEGTDDVCTVDSLIEWLKQDNRKPFLGVLWTMMTHYPYYTPAETANYTKDQMLNRYLNALHRGDMALGKLLHWLEAEGLMESTVVIVLGDHGEAFGQHHQIGHGFRIYEETLHVPLILINPSVFHGEEYSTIGMLCDIAPSVMNLLQLPSETEWQGRDLFASDRPGRAYFCVLWSDRLFGYREGNRKFIFNATRNSYEIYDLQNDPLETKNLAPLLPEAVRSGLQRLASWVQFEDKLMRKLRVKDQ